MENEPEEWTQDLEKYYDYVRNCTLCKKVYGCNKEGDSGICPRCVQNMRANATGANGIIRRSLHDGGP